MLMERLRSEVPPLMQAMTRETEGLRPSVTLKNDPSVRLRYLTPYCAVAQTGLQIEMRLSCGQ